MTSGIYKITNTLTGKIYIGASRNMTARFYQHKSTLNSNSHRCAPLQQDWNLYGQEAFNFNVIQEVEIEDLATVEKCYIEENLDSCYNQKLGGYYTPGFGSTKVRWALIAEENLLNQFKRIAEHQRWSFATATEVALELFVEKYGLQLPGLVETSVEAPVKETAR